MSPGILLKWLTIVFSVRWYGVWTKNIYPNLMHFHFYIFRHNLHAISNSNLKLNIFVRNVWFNIFYSQPCWFQRNKIDAHICIDLRNIFGFDLSDFVWTCCRLNSILYVPLCMPRIRDTLHSWNAFRWFSFHWTKFISLILPWNNRSVR